MVFIQTPPLLLKTWMKQQKSLIKAVGQSGWGVPIPWCSAFEGLFRLIISLLYWESNEPAWYLSRQSHTWKSERPGVSCKKPPSDFIFLKGWEQFLLWTFGKGKGKDKALKVIAAHFPLPLLLRTLLCWTGIYWIEASWGSIGQNEPKAREPRKESWELLRALIEGSCW